MGRTRDAPRPESSRRGAWLPAGVVALVCLLFQPAAARALTTQFVLNPSLSLVAMNGDFTNYASNTALSFQLDFDQAVGSVIPVSFGNFTLPDVQIALGGRYSFTVQSPQNGFSGTLDLATGALLSNPVTVLLQQISSNGVVSSSSIFSLSLTTGTINRGACGQFAGGPLSGTAMNLNTGAATLVAAGCLPPSAPSTLFGLRLAGATPPFPVPESGTLLLLGSGLIGLAGARRGRLGAGPHGPGIVLPRRISTRCDDTFEVPRPLL